MTGEKLVNNFYQSKTKLQRSVIISTVKTPMTSDRPGQGSELV